MADGGAEPAAQGFLGEPGRWPGERGGGQGAVLAARLLSVPPTPTPGRAPSHLRQGWLPFCFSFLGFSAALQLLLFITLFSVYSSAGATGCGGAGAAGGCSRARASPRALC